MKNYLEFEKEIKSLETDLDSLKSPFGSEGISEVDTQKIRKTEDEINNKLKLTYENLNSWQKTLVARHEDRPRANFYIKKIFTSFTALSNFFQNSSTLMFMPGITSLFINSYKTELIVRFSFLILFIIYQIVFLSVLAPKSFTIVVIFYLFSDFNLDGLSS